jgi:hypothetical protein
MEVTSSLKFQAERESKYDRMSELKAFDESKAGVKGLADAGVTKIPRIFILLCGRSRISHTNKKQAEQMGFSV